MNNTKPIDLPNKEQSLKIRPLKILNVVGSMNRGGIETWLMHVLRNIDRNLFQMDFMVHTLKSCDYDDEIRSLGCRIISSPYLPHPSKLWWTYAENFRQILQQYGAYDVVHSHVHYFDGQILRIAKQAGVPVRISHSHNDTSVVSQAGWKKRFYSVLMNSLISRHATIGLACSQQAAVDLFGKNWQNDRRWQILYCGLDMSPFQEPVDPVEVRSELGIPQDAFVIGHVGRFESQKNHHFLVKIFAEIARRESKICLLLVGNGSLRSQIERELAQLSLTDKVILTGVRPDVPRIMLGAMDAFVFPSLYEGLGLVLIEAQAAGLPCVLSDVVPEAADVVKPLLSRLSLSQSASQWADVILAQKNEAFKIEQSAALSMIKHNSPFSIETSAKSLTDIYSGSQTQSVKMENQLKA